MNLLTAIQNITIFLLLFFVFFAFLIIFLDIIFSILRIKILKNETYKVNFLKILIPSDNEFEIKAAEHMFSSLTGIKRPFLKALVFGQYTISFEIISKDEGIGFYVVVPIEISDLVEKQINGAYPTAEIDIVNPQEIWDRGKYTFIEELKLKGTNYFPIKVYEEIKGDPLNIITSSLNKVSKDEVLSIQLIIQSASENWRKASRKFVRDIKNKASNPEKKVNIDTSFLENVEKKSSHLGFYTKIRLVSISDKKENARANINHLSNSFEQFTDPNYNRFVKRFKFFYREYKLVNQFIHRILSVKDWYIPILDIPIYTNCSILNIVELATIFHLPNKDVLTPNIIWLAARKSSAPLNLAPENMDQSEGIWLGESNFRGSVKQINIKNEDLLRHMYIIGQTGTGKSESMSYYAYENILRGEGVAFVDPHGKDLRNLLKKIPRERIKDVILFNPADEEYPIGLNLLIAKNEVEKHQIVNQFIELLKKLYDPQGSGIVGPILERAVRNSMLTAMTDPEGNLIDVLRMNIDNDYHKKFLPNVTDPLVRRYWTDEFEQSTANTKSEKMGYIVSKFDRFVSEITMRRIIGQSKLSIDFDEVINNKKILLIDLAKGKIGEENANFLGLLIVPKLVAAALRRQKLIETGQKFPTFYLYVDEFQNFATDSFKTILSEARKYKLALCMAHQYVSQIPEDIKEAIFGNVGTKIVYRIGSEDGELLEKEFEPVFKAIDMTKLTVGNCYVRLLVNGQPTSPFSMNVSWSRVSKVPEDEQVAQEIIEYSRKTYGTPIDEVERQSNKRAGIEEDNNYEDDINNKDFVLPF